MCAPFWINAHWNKCTCILSSETVSIHVVTSLTLFHWRARSQLQSAVLPSGPKVCWFSCLLNFGSLVQWNSTVAENTKILLQEGTSLESAHVLITTSALAHTIELLICVPVYVLGHETWNPVNLCSCSWASEVLFFFRCSLKSSWLENFFSHLVNWF